MKCPRCSYASRAGTKFCEQCGFAFPRACPSCGSGLSATAKFCAECGHPVGVAESAPDPHAPQSYTPKHLAEKILNSRSALEGERKQVTVLFVDIVGSTSQSEQMDPEEVH